MSVAVTPFLRNALYVDALATGATALLAIVGAPLLAPFLDLPEALLLWAGLALVPFVAMLVVVARRAAVPKLILFDIVALNVLWVIGSFALLVTGAVAPNALGIAFVAAQALAVAVFAELQFIGIRRADAATA
ncbi:hypothetical protein [Aminobacter sp. Piv2-1]|uniref:hypothetical protein n=1 Tax=Aminobacter sp. Piv2-1 TaxID=3031122 RepID=UPI0030A9D468